MVCCMLLSLRVMNSFWFPRYKMKFYYFTKHVFLKEFMLIWILRNFLSLIRKTSLVRYQSSQREGMEGMWRFRGPRESTESHSELTNFQFNTSFQREAWVLSSHRSCTIMSMSGYPLTNENHLNLPHGKVLLRSFLDSHAMNLAWLSPPSIGQHYHLLFVGLWELTWKPPV